MKRERGASVVSEVLLPNRDVDREVLVGCHRCDVCDVHSNVRAGAGAAHVPPYRPKPMRVTTPQPAHAPGALVYWRRPATVALYRRCLLLDLINQSLELAQSLIDLSLARPALDPRLGLWGDPHLPSQARDRRTGLPIKHRLAPRRVCRCRCCLDLLQMKLGHRKRRLLPWRGLKLLLGSCPR